MSRSLSLVLVLLFVGMIIIGCGRPQEGEIQKEKQRKQAEKSPSPEEPLIAFEKDGAIWVIEASGEGMRKLTPENDFLLGPWSPDGKKMAVLTSVDWSDYWVTGYAAVLGLDGTCKPVLGPQGRFNEEPGEIAWLSPEELVLASLDTIWVAREKGDCWSAQVVYTTGKSEKERVWHPRQGPGKGEVSFWITSPGRGGEAVEAQLVILSCKDRKSRKVFQKKVWASGQAPVDVLWSPGGKYGIIYAETEGENCWWLFDNRSEETRPILNPNAGDVQWLSEKTVVFAPQAGLDVPRYEVLDVETGEVKPFTDLPSWVNWIEVSPDGGKILLAKAAGEGADEYFKWDIYLADADGGRIQKLVAGVGDASWQP
ncbi:MAG TPA: hypothetical protein DCE07_08185 [Peptococcaceae bacterium]|nr:hypothetical protein [Peptococcaceae bacterium]